MDRSDTGSSDVDYLDGIAESDNEALDTSSAVNYLEGIIDTGDIGQASSDAPLEESPSIEYLSGIVGQLPTPLPLAKAVPSEGTVSVTPQRRYTYNAPSQRTPLEHKALSERMHSGKHKKRISELSDSIAHLKRARAPAGRTKLTIKRVMQIALGNGRRGNEQHGLDIKISRRHLRRVQAATAYSALMKQQYLLKAIAQGGTASRVVFYVNALAWDATEQKVAVKVSLNFASMRRRAAKRGRSSRSGVYTNLLAIATQRPMRSKPTRVKACLVRGKTLKVLVSSQTLTIGVQAQSGACRVFARKFVRHCVSLSSGHANVLYNGLFEMDLLKDVDALDKKLAQTAQVTAYHFDRDGDAVNDCTI